MQINGISAATLAEGSVYSAGWSPDGHWIAYTDDFRLHIVNVETGERRQLLDETNAFYRQWSPDSKQILITTLAITHPQIYITNLEGETRLIYEVGYNFAQW